MKQIPHLVYRIRSESEGERAEQDASARIVIDRTPVPYFVMNGYEFCLEQSWLPFGPRFWGPGYKLRLLRQDSLGLIAQVKVSKAVHDAFIKALGAYLRRQRAVASSKSKVSIRSAALTSRIGRARRAPAVV